VEVRQGNGTFVSRNRTVVAAAEAKAHSKKYFKVDIYGKICYNKRN